MGVTPSLEFRKATMLDAARLVDLVNGVYRGTSGRQWTTEAHLVEGPRLDAPMLRAMLGRPGSVVLAVSTTGSPEIHACVHLEAVGEVCELGMLSVAGAAQQAGIGRAVLVESERYAREHLGASVIRIHVIRERPELITWYERRGYRRTGEDEPFGGEAASRSHTRRGPLTFLILAKSIQGAPPRRHA
jgi:GNAT superfamily N-acetyltransferase